MWFVGFHPTNNNCNSNNSSHRSAAQMRTTPALLVLTLAASTASVAAPVIEFPGGSSAHAVEPKIVEVALGAPDLTRVAGRLLGPADLTAAFSLVGVTWDRPAQSADSFTLSLR